MVSRKAIATNLAIKVACFRIGIPTFVLLYFNIVIAMTILGYSIRPNVDFFDGRIVGGGVWWPIALIVATIIVVQGLLYKVPKVVSIGSFFGFTIWTLDLTFWLIQSDKSIDFMTLFLSVPMMVFFSFVHMKYSLLQRYQREHPDD